MPTERTHRSNPISKRDFHVALMDWLANTSDAIVGSEAVDGRTPWIHVLDGDTMFVLHADTRRDSVLHYLKLVAIHGESIAWKVVPSQRKRMTAVAYGPSEERYKPFYLYVA